MDVLQLAGCRPVRPSHRIRKRLNGGGEGKLTRQIEHMLVTRYNFQKGATSSKAGRNLGHHLVVLMDSGPEQMLLSPSGQPLLSQIWTMANCCRRPDQAAKLVVLQEEEEERQPDWFGMSAGKVQPD